MAEEEKKMGEDKERASLSDSDGGPSEQQETGSTTPIETGEFVVSGPNANINVNKASHQDFLAIHEYSYKQGYEAATDLLRGKGWTRGLGEELLSKKEQKDTEDTHATTASGKEMKQLETPEDVADWYENLPDLHTQYLVQTISCLHGAQVTDVARLMKTLQAPLLTQGQQSNDGVPGQSARPISDRELYRHACIERRRINGVARLFWKELDGDGQQRFTVLVL